MRRFLLIVLVALLALSSVACGVDSDSKSKIKIGISMPIRKLEHWSQDKNSLSAALEEAGYETDLQYADNEVETQVTQVENMIFGGCDILIISPIDPLSLSEALAPCAEQGITVISYNRLITGTDAVSYYASFDIQSIGKLQGKYIEQSLNLEKKRRAL